MPFAWLPSTLTPATIQRFYETLIDLDQKGFTLVASAGNHADEPDASGNPRTNIDTYPAMFGNPNAPNNQYIQNLIVVGAVDIYGQRTAFSQLGDYIATYAPGANEYSASGDVGLFTPYFNPFPNGNPTYINTDPSDGSALVGTSFSAPLVAGLAAYLKALPSQWQVQMNQANSNGPKAVKASK